MCCLGEYIIKYALIISNILFAILGLAIASIGIVLMVQLKNILELIPENIYSVPISITVLGGFVFVIAYLACCGAIKESRCMLLTYSIIMVILAAGKIYLTVVVTDFTSAVNSTVTRWINSAFNNPNLRPAYSVMEHLFRCCGTTGAGSYGQVPIPESCCAEPVDDQCSLDNSYNGCTDILVDYFQSFSEAIAAMLVVIIIIEVVAVVFALSLSNSIRQNNKRKQYA